MDIRLSFKGEMMGRDGNLGQDRRASFSIIPMALAQSGRFDPDLWARVAGGLDLVIESVAHCDVDVENLLRNARVLSFPQAIGVLGALTEEAGTFPEWMEGPVVSYHFDFVKEGHTSSVWKTEIGLASGETRHFAVNVARDYIAGRDLRRSSRMLEVLAIDAPDLTVAEPVVILERKAAVGPVTVTINRWIEGAEVHFLSEKTTDSPGLFEIYDFLCKADLPGRIAGVRCRRLTPQESARATVRVADIDRALKAEDIVRKCGGAPAVSVNEGDLMWTGNDLAIVALSPEPGGASDLGV